MEAILKREIIFSKPLCRIIGVSVFIILTALGAFVRLPLPGTPVPFTLQTFFVLLSGACLGSSLAAASQAGYIFLGLAGLPIFTGAGSGLLYFFGPTGGYLLGFILAGFLAGRLTRYTANSLCLTFLAILAADFILLACGTMWLAALSGCSLMQALTLGFIPFIPGDVVKAYAVSVVFLKINPRLKQIF